MHSQPLPDLPGYEDWESFPRIVPVLERLGWKILQHFDGPDVRVCNYLKGEQEVMLTLDDAWGYWLRTEDQGVDLEGLAHQIVEALKLDG
jgi:hypothetical protein